MEIFNTFNSLFAILFLSVTVNCSVNWCPCLHPSDSRIQNTSSHEINSNVCEKYKGVFFSEEREFKCECCLILRKYKESCKPAKNPKFVVRCKEGLFCDDKYICKVPERRQSIMLVVHNPRPNHEIGRSFGISFGELLRKMFGCDCTTAQCDNEVTRQECEDHQGLFVDKLSVRNRCQCCDRCYIPRGQHQSCGDYHKKNVQYVCDTGLYCSPFTHMCIEKREIFSQFLKNVKKENILKKSLGVFEEESLPNQTVYLSLNRKKRDDEEAAETTTAAAEGGETSSTEGEVSSTAAGGEGGESSTAAGGEGGESSTAAGGEGGESSTAAEGESSTASGGESSTAGGEEGTTSGEETSTSEGVVEKIKDKISEGAEKMKGDIDIDLDAVSNKIGEEKKE